MAKRQITVIQSPVEYEAFWHKLTETPTDTTTKQVFADFAADRDDDRLAHALRWCLSWNRWPRLYTVGSKRWEWCGGPGRQFRRSKTMSNVLPSEVYNGVRSRLGVQLDSWRRQYQRTSQSLVLPIYALAEALADLAVVCNLYPEPQQ